MYLSERYGAWELWFDGDTSYIVASYNKQTRGMTREDGTYLVTTGSSISPISGEPCPDIIKDVSKPRSIEWGRTLFHRFKANARQKDLISPQMIHSAFHPFEWRSVSRNQWARHETHNK